MMMLPHVSGITVNQSFSLGVGSCRDEFLFLSSAFPFINLSDQTNGTNISIAYGSSEGQNGVYDLALTIRVGLVAQEYPLRYTNSTGDLVQQGSNQTCSITCTKDSDCASSSACSFSSCIGGICSWKNISGCKSELSVQRGQNFSVGRADCLRHFVFLNITDGQLLIAQNASSIHTLSSGGIENEYGRQYTIETKHLIKGYEFFLKHSVRGNSAHQILYLENLNLTCPSLRSCSVDDDCSDGSFCTTDTCISKLCANTKKDPLCREEGYVELGDDFFVGTGRCREEFDFLGGDGGGVNLTRSETNELVVLNYSQTERNVYGYKLTLHGKSEMMEQSLNNTYTLRYDQSRILLYLEAVNGTCPLTDGCESNADCADENPCTIDLCEGAPLSCNQQFITYCKSGDGCCADKCSLEEDEDCADEICTTSTDCEDGNSSTVDLCTTEKKCVHGEASCISGDSLCPPLCLYSNDTDCGACRSDADCNDGNSSTFDQCTGVPKQCTYGLNCVHGDGQCIEGCTYETDNDCLSPTVCGDGRCDASNNESLENCCKDCGCQQSYECREGSCVKEEGAKIRESVEADVDFEEEIDALLEEGFVIVETPLLLVSGGYEYRAVLRRGEENINVSALTNEAGMVMRVVSTQGFRWLPILYLFSGLLLLGGGYYFYTTRSPSHAGSKTVSGPLQQPVSAQQAVPQGWNQLSANAVPNQESVLLYISQCRQYGYSDEQIRSVLQQYVPAGEIQKLLGMGR